MKKLLKTMLASLALAALVVSCGTAFQIGNINLDDPEVKAESKFGGVLLSWDKVDMADTYYIYRAEPVEADAKKAKSDAAYEEKEYIGYINKSKASGKIYFADKIRVGNVLEEGKTYQYTVEAIAGDGSDARVAATADEADKQYARGTCVVEVTIAEGTAPAFGSKVTAPTKTTFINYATSEELNRSSGAKIQVLPDELDDDRFINTYSYVECTALPATYSTNIPGVGDEVLQFWTNADSIVYLPLPGEYTVYSYNSAETDYYIESDKVAAEETVKVSYGENEDTGKYGTISNFDASVGSGAASAVITWKADKKAAANYSYKLLKGEYTSVYSDYNLSTVPAFKELVEVDISTMKKEAAADGSITYTVIDNTVEAGKNYAYFLQAIAEGKARWSDWDYFTVNDNLNATQLSGTNSVDETVYVNIDATKDYYAFKEVTFGKGAKDKTTAIVEKWNPETGYGEAAAVAVTVEETPISEEDSLYQWNIIQKGITSIEEDEALKYTVTMTDAEGNKKVWYWYTYLTCKPTAARATLNRITVLSKTATSANLEIKIGVLPDTKLEDVSVKLIVKKLINGGDSYTFVPVTVKAFELDPAVGSAPARTATGTAQLTDLIKETDYSVEGYIIVDGYNDGSEPDEYNNVSFTTLAN